MVPPKQPTRGQQHIRSGLGLAFTSPIKWVNKRKTTMLIQPFGQAVKHHCLQSKLDNLLLRPRYRRENSPPTAPTPGPCKPDPLLTDEGPSMLDELPGMDIDIDLDSPPSTSRQIVPNEKSHNLYKKWGCYTHIDQLSAVLHCVFNRHYRPTTFVYSIDMSPNLMCPRH